MQKKIDKLNILVFASIVLLIIITLTGFLSFNTDESYTVTNKYGSEVRIFGSGIYAHDSFFRAPIFIGSDATMLFLVVPMLTFALIDKIKRNTEKAKLRLASVIGVVLYYSISITFGVSYNSYHLLYIALFSCSLFAFVMSLSSANKNILQAIQTWQQPTTGIRIFLILTGIALFAAWLPDIIPTIISGSPLALIEVYTTEITYALDMGIISPLMFICLYLLKIKNGTGYAMLAIILKLCIVMGVMLPIQTAFQIFAGIDTPLPVLLTKVSTFVILAAFALFFNTKFYRGVENE